MKHFGFAILLGLVLTVSGCGGSSSGASQINGNWTASMINADGSQAFSFATALRASNGSSNLTINNFTFTTAGTCFNTSASQTGTFSFTGDFQGHVTGTFSMIISTAFPSGTNNVLTLQGAVNGPTISGTWTLTGVTGCSGNGSFSMTRM